MTQCIEDLDFAEVVSHAKTPSVSAWEDEVLYFLIVDRFSDGSERMPGASDGTTPPLTVDDYGNAVADEATAATWRTAGRSWVGGTLRGVMSKLNYLADLGVTALWVSPILKQAAAVQGEAENYHGYATQNFLEVDPHLGTKEDFRQLVAMAHERGIKVILDIVINHAGRVFEYTNEAAWSGATLDVAGWRGANGEVAAFAEEGAQSLWPDGAVWPKELQAPDSFTRKGYISNWDNFPEYIEGDFMGLRDIWHGDGSYDDFVPSRALITLTKIYCWWLAYADLDGFRIDTVKHVNTAATRYFVSMIHEYAQSIGKDRFILIGEIVESREQTIDTMRYTGLDAALGIADVQYWMEAVAKGRQDPSGYFDLFRNSALLGVESHTWFRNTVVTLYDDQDQVRKGDSKSRYAADDDGKRLPLTVLALNIFTLGIPCIYYGSEQGLDGGGSGPWSDVYIREAMFGGEFGAFRTRGRHVFNTDHQQYVELRRMIQVRKDVPALRRGRQYLRQISGNGENFGYPTGCGNRVRSIIAWSRILTDEEVVCAINVDPDSAHATWITIDNALHGEGDVLRCLYASGNGTGIKKTLEVIDKNGACVHVTLPPGGVAVYTSRAW